MQKDGAEAQQGAMTSAAIGLTILSGLLYVLGYAPSKIVVTDHGLTALQVTFLRCVVILVVSLAATSWPSSRLTWRRMFRRERAWERRGAAAALVVSNVLAVLAYTLLSVTAASALGFTAPLLLAVPVTAYWHPVSLLAAD